MGSALFGPAVQLWWDDRVVVPLDFAWVSIMIPASFADLVWLTCLPGREAPEQIMLSAYADVLEDDGHRLRLALHQVAIALDDH